MLGFPATRRFEFATAGRLVFGAGTLAEVVGLAAGMGGRPLVVTGSDPARAGALFALLAGSEPAADPGGAGSSGAEGDAPVALRNDTVGAPPRQAVTYSVTGEPDVDVIRRGTALARRERCDWVVGFGGGAVVDAAKAIAILATNPGDVLDYLEIIGRGMAPTRPPLPCVAIPTTAGTGSEVTRNSVIASREQRVKVSLRSPLMLPRVAIVDPELTYSLPPAITAATGVDALTQLIEPFVCRRANPFTDALCREGIPRVARSLPRAYANAGDRGAPADAAAREDMAVASLFGGLCLANAGLGAVHGLAGPLGGMISAPHGAVCAALLPAVVAGNLRALRARAPRSLALSRYSEVARLLTGDATAKADDAVGWLRDLVADLAIPGLGTYGVDGRTIAELVEKAARASSMKANPVELTCDELTAIVEEAV